MKFRCQYKVASLAYRHFEGSLPPYLFSSLCTYEPSRSLRSYKEKLLKIPKRNLKSFGEHSFSFMAPSVWNSLPANLKKNCQHYFSSNLTSKPSCSPRLSRRSSTPNYRLCMCICFVFKCGEMYVERGDGRIAWGDSLCGCVCVGTIFLTKCNDCWWETDCRHACVPFACVCVSEYDLHVVCVCVRACVCVCGEGCWCYLCTAQWV